MGALLTGQQDRRAAPNDPAITTASGQAAVLARRSSIRRSALVLLSFTVLAVVYFAGAWRDPTHRIVGSPGDPSLFVWYLRWIPWAIAHGHNPLFTSWVNAPHGVNLMWNTALLLPAIVLAPVTVLCGPTVTYNVLATASVTLSGWTAWMAFGRVGRVSPGPAWLGGLVFAFSPFIVAQVYGHLHLSAAFLLPVLAMATHEVVVVQQRSARRGGLLLGGAAGAQFLIGEELLAIAAVALAVAVLVATVLYPSETRRRAVRAGRAVPWTLAAFLVIAGGPLVYQFFGRQVVHGPAQLTDYYVADLLAPVVPTRWQWLHPWGSLSTAAHFQSQGAEWCAYLGVPLILLVVAVAIAQRRHRGVVVATVTAAVVVVLAFGAHLRINGTRTGILLPWSAFGWATPLESLLPVRLMVTVDFIAAGMVAVAAEAAWRARRSVVGPAVGVAVALALVPLVPAMHFRASRWTVPSFFTSPAVRLIPAGSFVVVAPAPEPRNVATLRWQVASGFRFKMAGGYALVPDERHRPSFVGPGTATRAVIDALQDGSPVGSLDLLTVVGAGEELRSSGASTVLVGPMAHRDRVIALFTDLLRTQPIETGGVALWSDVPRLLHGA